MLDNSLATRVTAATRPSTAQPGAVRPAKSRSVVTNRPRKQVLSGNTPEGRRLLDFADALAAGLGGWPALTELQGAACRHLSRSPKWRGVTCCSVSGSLTRLRL